VKATVEIVREVWPDCGGWHYEIGPDRDGLGSAEIRYFELEKPEPAASLVFTPEEAVAVGQALLACASELRQPPDDGSAA